MKRHGSATPPRNGGSHTFLQSKDATCRFRFLISELTSDLHAV